MSRRLGVAALLAAGVIGALGAAGPATSAQRTVAISGRAYAFNHSDTGLAGAVIRVRELPQLSAVADAVGDYVLRVPDDTNVTPYIEPPPGYHQIDLQTFHTRGEPIETPTSRSRATRSTTGFRPCSPCRSARTAARRSA